MKVGDLVRMTDHSGKPWGLIGLLIKKKHVDPRVEFFIVKWIGSKGNAHICSAHNLKVVSENR